MAWCMVFFILLGLKFSRTVSSPKLQGSHNKWIWFTDGSGNKESACNAGSPGFSPWVRKIPWRREWLSTAVFLPGESHGQRSPAGYYPWSRKRSDTTEQLTLSPPLRWPPTRDGQGLGEPARGRQGPPGAWTWAGGVGWGQDRNPSAPRWRQVHPSEPRGRRSEPSVAERSRASPEAQRSPGAARAGAAPPRSLGAAAAAAAAAAAGRRWWRWQRQRQGRWRDWWLCAGTGRRNSPSRGGRFPST